MGLLCNINIAIGDSLTRLKYVIQILTAYYSFTQCYMSKLTADLSDLRFNPSRVLSDLLNDLRSAANYKKKAYKD